MITFLVPKLWVNDAEAALEKLAVKVAVSVTLPPPPPEPNPLLTAEADIKLSSTKDAVNAYDAVAGCSTLPELSVVTTLPPTSFIRF